MLTLSAELAAADAAQVNMIARLRARADSLDSKIGAWLTSTSQAADALAQAEKRLERWRAAVTALGATPTAKQINDSVFAAQQNIDAAAFALGEANAVTLRRAIEDTARDTVRDVGKLTTAAIQAAGGAIGALLPWYVWAGGALLLILIILVALRGRR